MTDAWSGEPGTPETWARRVHEAELVGERWAPAAASSADDEQAQAWLSSIDTTAYVGKRHHTVPRFLLQRWADHNSQVRVYRRIEQQHSVENISDLAIRDFYTVVNEDGTKNSALESLLGYVESRAKLHIDQILNPFVPPKPLSASAVADLVQFASFQSVRTARHRKEIELYADWYAKTMAAGHVSDSYLRDVSFAPHQNDTATLALESAELLSVYFACRPMAILNLSHQLLHLCDEPIVLNAPTGDVHHADCALSDVEIEQRTRRQLRKVKQRKRGRAKKPGRVVHFTSTMPTGHGVADEIVLAISPRTALVWGPLADAPPNEPPTRLTLNETESQTFAEMLNTAMSNQALDWIVTRTGDDNFRQREFPPAGPLMSVCDGSNAAAAAINDVPSRFRPRRLWTP